MAKRVGSHLAVYNLGGITLPDGAETGLFVDASGSLLVAASFAGTSDMNLKQINGNTVVAGNGVSGTGVLRVAQVSDGTGVLASVGAITGSIVPGTGATNLGKAEDAVHSSGDTGIMVLGVGNEAQVTFAADGDYIPHSVDTKGNNITVGNIASGATDSGFPVKVGARNNTTRPTLTDGQRGDVQLDTRANVAVTLFAANSANGISAIASNADAQATTSTTSRFEVMSRNTGYNETSFDRWRNNTEATILASAVRTATTNGPDQTNYNARGVMLILNVSVEAATETLSVKIQAKDSISGNYADFIDFGVVYNATTMAPGAFVAIAYPGLLTADLISGAVGKSTPLPRVWRPVVTHSSSGSWTYSLSGEVIL